MDDILKTLRVSASGMKSQGTRLRVIAENIANADSLPTSPEDTPYRRKLVMFKNALDRATGLDTVRVHKIQDSNGSFGRKYLPGHPAADADGYVVTPKRQDNDRDGRHARGPAFLRGQPQRHQGLEEDAATNDRRAALNRDAAVWPAVVANPEHATRRIPMPGPINSYSNAVAAYNRVARGAAPEEDKAPAKSPSNPDDTFGGLVRNAIREAVRIGEASEKLSIAAINDRADINQVVTAVAEAETTLQTVVSVRDKVIEAYREVIRMPM